MNGFLGPKHLVYQWQKMVLVDLNPTDDGVLKRYKELVLKSRRELCLFDVHLKNITSPGPPFMIMLPVKLPLVLEHWFLHHFLPKAPSERPLLLLMDGHSTHFSPVFVNKAAEEHIIVFCLPPHTTHKTQPLDKGVFSPLKTAWREVCHSYIIENPGKVVTRYQFSQLFGQAWMKAMTPPNIISGFSVTGIYPTNRFDFLYTRIVMGSIVNFTEIRVLV